MLIKPTPSTDAESRANYLADYAIRWLVLNAPMDTTVRSIHHCVRKLVEWDRTQVAKGGWNSAPVSLSLSVFIRTVVGGETCLPLYLRLLS